MSNNLNLDQVTGNQNQKEVTINDQAGQLDAALTEVLAVPVDNTEAVTLTSTQFQRNMFFALEDAGSPPGSAITITVPAVQRGLFIVYNGCAFDATVEITGQAETSPVVEAGGLALLSCDGTNVQQPAGGGGGGGGSGVLKLGFQVPGKPDDGSMVARYIFLDSAAFDVNMAGSRAISSVAADLDSDFDLQKNGVSFGTMTFASGDDFATFVAASGPTFVAGDVLTIVAPSPQDADLEDVTIGLKGI